MKTEAVDMAGTLVLMIGQNSDSYVGCAGMLIKTSSDFNKNLTTRGSIGGCTNKDALNNVLEIIDYHPPLINKLFLSGMRNGIKQQVKK